MNTIKWLVRREIWEHKGGLVWAPAAAAIITLVLLVLGMILGSNGDGSVAFSEIRFATPGHGINPRDQSQIVAALTTGYIGFAIPVFIVLGFIVFFFSLSTLSDERKDRSVLFWKSMPVSDERTIASKALLALVVAPGIAALIAIATSLIGLLLILAFGAFHGLNLFGEVLSTAAFYATPLQLLSLIPVYALWALPAVGWLMLVGALAPRKAFLWALLVPILAAAMVTWLSMGTPIDAGWFWQNITGRLLLGVAPGSWMILDLHSDVDGTIAYQAWATLGSMKLWVGALAGAAMLLASARIRRWKDEG